MSDQHGCDAADEVERKLDPSVGFGEKAGDVRRIGGLAELAEEVVVGGLLLTTRPDGADKLRPEGRVVGCGCAVDEEADAGVLPVPVGNTP